MRRRWIPAFWIAFALVSSLQTYISMIAHGHSLARIALYELVVWAGWAALTPIVFRLGARWPLVPPSARAIALHAAAAIVLGAAHTAWWLGATVTLRPYDAMTVTGFLPHLPDKMLTRLPLEIILYAGVLAAGHARLLAGRAAELDRSLARARLHALELQIQPHFLFNTLHAVTALVRAHRSDEAVEVLAALADLLRYTLAEGGDQRVALTEEARMLERYLAIQRTRFADRLTVSIDIDDEARRAAVPRFILQPLAENAIRHGIARSAQPGRVAVRARRHEDALEIEVWNTGSLAAPDGAGGGGIGLRNTLDRLRQCYGGAHRFALREADGGVLAWMSLPFQAPGAAEQRA